MKQAKTWVWLWRIADNVDSALDGENSNRRVKKRLVDGEKKPIRQNKRKTSLQPRQ